MLHETIRRNVLQVPGRKVTTSGYLTYDEQYVNIDGRVGYSALLKGVKNGNFTVEILDDLKRDTLISFFISALLKLIIHGMVTTTTKEYHYEYALKDLSHKIKLAQRVDEFDDAMGSFGSCSSRHLGTSGR